MTAEANPASLPKGKYTIVGLDVDTTGRRLIDEIIQIGAYTPTESYSEYIMPYMNLNPAARNRHQVRVITIGFFRILKNLATNKVIKTKSEISALKGFLDWIEKLHAADTGSNGVIFVYHEERKFVPYMLLEAMAKYDLTERFLKTCKSMANSYNLSEEKCSSSVKSLNLKQLGKVLLNIDDTPDKNRRQMHTEGNARVRSRLAYEVTRHLACDEQGNLNTEDAYKTMMDVVLGYATPVEGENTQLKEEALCVERQNSFRPVFGMYFQASLFYRLKAVTFRRVLAKNGFDLNRLEKIWLESKKDGLADAINNIPYDIKDDEKTELVNLFDSYFDPEKETIIPIVKKPRSTRRRSPRKGRSGKRLPTTPEKEAREGPIATKLPASPDTTIPALPLKQSEPTKHTITTTTALTEVC